MSKFEASFESLAKFECPDWFRDAKFGIWSHWGPQSVPMIGDWYARNMYIQGRPEYLYHVRTFGHPSKVGFKDVCALWKAENFNPEELMDLYYQAGARYFVAQAMHHDHFFNYDSQINPMNSVKVGPHKDVCGLWKEAAGKYHLPFGLTEHLGASFSWWNTSKGCDTYGPYKGVPYDGNDPANKNYYHDNYEHIHYDKEDPWEQDIWYTQNKKFQQYWLSVMRELIDKYEPDLLYSDGGLPFANAEGNVHGRNSQKADLTDEAYQAGLSAVAYLYDKSIEKHGKNIAIYTQKDRRPAVYSIGILDVEKSQLPDILPHPWQTDTCIGNWFYDKKQVYKHPDQLIEMLVDIIAKNGTMLLNILQKPDGSIDEEARYILAELGKWFAICSEGVYGTRPWKVSGEGESRVATGMFQEDKVSWSSSDYRFTMKENTVFTFMPCAPKDGVAVLRSFANERIETISLLGYGKVDFSNNYGLLSVKLPAKLPTEYTNCLAIKLKN